MNDTESVFRPIVGIDLGTTNSLVAYIRDGRPEILPVDGQALTPSIVHRAVDGTLLVGQDAKAALIAMPERTIASIKRRMGTDAVVKLGEEEHSPIEISAFILAKIKDAVDALYGEGPKEAVITVPAYFDDRQRRDTKAAGEQAGFVVERIINEPTAAALAFGLGQVEMNEKVLVYDLGGGTFDVSIVEMESGILEVKASNGHRALGGDDFDRLIVNDWVKEIVDSQSFDATSDVRAMAVLKMKAEEAKIALSDMEQVSVEIPLVAISPTGTPISFSKTMTRSYLEKLLERALKTTMTLVRDTLKDAQLRPSDITAVLLVGGSTRIPRVRQLIEAEFGQTARTEVHPDEAVALGAAVQAGIKSGSLAESGLIVTDVAPFTMGIAIIKEDRRGVWQQGGYAPIIPKNATIPTTRTERFTTIRDGQTTIKVEVYQGESEWVRGNHKLGEISVEGLPPRPAGVEAINVTFRYTLNGILEVSTQSLSTGKEMRIRVQDALDRSSQQALADTKERLETLLETEELWDEDEPDEGTIDTLLKDGDRLERQLKRLRNPNNRKDIDQLVAQLVEARRTNKVSDLENAIDAIYEWLLDNG